MAYAVVIYFDEISALPIIKVWKELEGMDVSREMNNLGIRPHITIAIYDSFNCMECEKEIQSFAEKSGLFNISIDHFGIFPNSSPVIFVAPAPNKKIMDFHGRIHQILENYTSGSWDMYQPGHWIPHVTLFRDNNNDNFSRALKICMKMKLPFEMNITQIGIVNFEPVQTLFEIDLESE